jgi:hypothetical protein
MFRLHPFAGLRGSVRIHVEGTKARMFVDPTRCEGDIDDGAKYLATNRASASLGHSESAVISESQVASLQVSRMVSIWKRN